MTINTVCKWINTVYQTTNITLRTINTESLPNNTRVLIININNKTINTASSLINTNAQLINTVVLTINTADKWINTTFFGLKIDLSVGIYVCKLFENVTKPQRFHFLLRGGVFVVSNSLFYSNLFRNQSVIQLLVTKNFVKTTMGLNERLDTDHLPDGLYYLLLNSSDLKKVATRFIIQH